MLSLARYLVPVAFATWFIVKAVRSPINACGLVLVFCTGPAVFLPTGALAIPLPGTSFLVTSEEFVLVLLIAAWAYVRWKRQGPAKGPAVGVLLAFLVGGLFLAIEVMVALVDPGTGSTSVVSRILIDSRPYVYFALGFLLWLDILRRTNRAEFWEFVGTLAGMTALLMIPYSLSAVGLHVYANQAFETLTINSRTVVRDFATFPYLTNLAVAYYVTRMVADRVTAARLVGLAMVALGVAMHLTRNTLLEAGVVILVACAYALFRGRGLRRLLVPAAVFASVGMAWVVLSLFASPNVAVLATRVGQLEQTSLEKTTLGSRLQVFESATRYVEKVDPVLGLGLGGTGPRDPARAGVLYWGDSMWYSVVVFSGIAGLVLVASLLLVGVVRSGQLAFDRDPLRSAVGLFVLLLLIWEVGSTFASEGYFSRYATALLSFAILACESRTMWWSPPVPVASRDLQSEASVVSTEPQASPTRPNRRPWNPGRQGADRAGSSGRPRGSW